MFCMGIKLNKIKVGSAIIRAVNEYCINNGHITEQPVLRRINYFTMYRKTRKKTYHHHHGGGDDDDDDDDDDVMLF